MSVTCPQKQLPFPCGAVCTKSFDECSDHVFSLSQKGYQALWKFMTLDPAGGLSTIRGRGGLLDVTSLSLCSLFSPWLSFRGLSLSHGLSLTHSHTHSLCLCLTIRLSSPHPFPAKAVWTMSARSPTSS